MTHTRTVVVETYAAWQRLAAKPGIVAQDQDLYDPATGTLYISPARAWQFD